MIDLTQCAYVSPDGVFSPTVPESERARLEPVVNMARPAAPEETATYAISYCWDSISGVTRSNWAQAREIDHIADRRSAPEPLPRPAVALDMELDGFHATSYPMQFALKMDEEYRKELRARVNRMYYGMRGEYEGGKEP